MGKMQKPPPSLRTGRRLSSLATIDEVPEQSTSRSTGRRIALWLWEKYKGNVLAIYSIYVVLMWLRLPFSLYGIIGIVSATAGVIAMLEYRSNDRLVVQREFITQMRKRVGKHFGLVGLADYKADDFENFKVYQYGPRVMALIFVPFIISSFWEGKIVASLNLLFNFLPWCTMMDGSASWRRVVILTRLNALAHLATLLVLGPGIYDIQAARRSLLIRLFTSMTCIEHLDELFIHLVVLMMTIFFMLFGYNQASEELFFLPIKLYSILVCTEFLGLRIYLARFVHTSSMKISDKARIAMIVTLAPVFIITFSYGLPGGGRFSMNNTGVIFYCFMAGYLFTPKAKEQIARHSTTEAQQALERRGPISEDYARGLIRIAFGLVAAICILHHSWILASLVCLMAFGASQQQVNLDVKRRLLQVTTNILFFAPSLVASNLGLAMLASVRLILAFEHRRLFDVSLESYVQNAFQLAVVPDTCNQRGMVGFIGMCATLVSIVKSLVQENIGKLLSIAQNADSFLDHALKQKFSSVGAALNQILDDDAKVGGQLDKDFRMVLEDALAECQTGQNSCYLSSYVLQHAGRGKGGAALTPSNPRGTLKPLWETVESWIRAGELPDCSFVCKSDDIHSIDIFLDWDVLKALLFDLAKLGTLSTGVKQTVFLVEIGEGREAVLRIRALPQLPASPQNCSMQDMPLNQPVRLHHHKHDRMTRRAVLSTLREQAAEAIGAKIKDQCLELKLNRRYPHTSFSPISMTSSLQTVSPVTSPTLSLSGMADVSLRSISSTGSKDRSSASFHQQHSKPPPPASPSPNLPRRSLTVSSPWHTTAENTSSSHSSLSSLQGGEGASDAVPLDNGSSGNGSGGYVFPPNLTIAVLDDSSLVRKSMQRLFGRHLRANAVSFSSGVSPEEAFFFPHELLLKNVDIAIFDENLDFQDHDIIKGTDLAKEARALGFAKCAVLHSANGELGKNLDPVFNGFVEKTTSRDAFVRKLEKVWIDYVHQQQQSS